jgi:hypothetical protein
VVGWLVLVVSYPPPLGAVVLVVSVVLGGFAGCTAEVSIPAELGRVVVVS